MTVINLCSRDICLFATFAPSTEEFGGLLIPSLDSAQLRGRAGNPARYNPETKHKHVGRGQCGDRESP